MVETHTVDWSILYLSLAITEAKDNPEYSFELPTYLSEYVDIGMKRRLSEMVDE